MSLLLLLRGHGAPVAHALAGQSDGQSTASGTLTVVRALSGQSNGTGSATGSLAVARHLAGQSNGASSATGALSVTHALAGTAAGTSTATGALNVAHPLAGASAGTSTASGTLHVAAAAFFPYGDFLEYLRASVESVTGKDAFLSFVTQGERPSEPFCVIHAFGPTGPLERALDGQAVVLSFYLQVDGVGRGYRDAMWMVDRAVAALRALPPPSYVNDLIVGARSSAFEIDSEALRALGQRVAVRLTRA